MKRHFQNNAGPEVPQVYNLRSRVQKTEIPEDPPAYNLRSKVQKTEGSKDPPTGNFRSKVQKTEHPKSSTVVQKREFPKVNGPKYSSTSIQKRGTQKKESQKTAGLKISAPLFRETATAKPSTPILTGCDKKSHPSSCQDQPYFYDPVYHIRWDGDYMECESSGQNCILCNKDLPRAPEDDDSGFHEHLNYGDGYDSEYEDYHEFRPLLLPAVDILSCGHAFHSECLKCDTAQERSSDPQCVLCAGIS